MSAARRIGTASAGVGEMAKTHARALATLPTADFVAARGRDRGGTGG